MAQIAVRDPLAEVRSRMRRAFGEIGARDLGDEFDALTVGVWGGRGRSRHIPMDVYETADGVIVHAWLPGFTTEEVQVTLETGKLSIRAEHPAEDAETPDAQKRAYFVRELDHGPASRSLLIGKGYDPDSIAGSLKHGMLTLTIKKLPAAQPRRITIAAEA